jgi:hypothetical protein
MPENAALDFQTGAVFMAAHQECVRNRENRFTGSALKPSRFRGARPEILQRNHEPLQIFAADQRNR